MSRRCECRPGDVDWCGFCDAAISRVEENRLFGFDGWSARDLDDMADALAADDWDNRGGVA
jgi:hypothetical protein